MAIVLEMPSLSPTMEKGNLVTWHKAEGDQIEVGDIIAEIETDKATMDLESVYKGTLEKILIPAGSKGVNVKTPIGIIRQKKDTDEDIANAIANLQRSSNEVAQVAEAKPVQETVQQTKESRVQEPDQRLKISPLAKRLAGSYGIDISKIVGSGPSGRIVKSDIQKMLSIPSTQCDAPKADFVDKPISSMRRIIAEKLTKAKQEIPHFYMNMSADATKLIDFRRSLNDSGVLDTKITINDLIIKAVAFALKQVTDVNVLWNGDSIRHFNTVDISVAVAVEGGIFTPVIFGADHKPLSDVSKEIKELASLAKDGKLSPQQYTGGTITISNLGMFEIDSFTSIINAPQSSILSVSPIKKEPIIRNDEIVIASVLHTCLAIDHRAIDGSVAAKFMQKLKIAIENPVLIFA